MAVDQESSDTTDSPAGSSGAVHSGPVPVRKGTTFETLAVCGFIFGLFAIVAAIFAVGLAARAASDASGSGGGGSAGGGTAGGGGAAVTEVSLGEFFIKPQDATAAADSVLKVKNDGTVDHDLAVEGGPATEMLKPGSEGELDLAGVAAGTYTWICQVPGHAAAGMKGTVTVQ